MFYSCNINQQFWSTIIWITHNHNCDSKFLFAPMTKIIFITCLYLKHQRSWLYQITVPVHNHTNNSIFALRPKILVTSSSLHYWPKIFNIRSSLHYGPKIFINNSSLHYRSKIFLNNSYLHYRPNIFINSSYLHYRPNILISQINI